jgi:hypothetical protein
MGATLQYPFVSGFEVSRDKEQKAVLADNDEK